MAVSPGLCSHKDSGSGLCSMTQSRACTRPALNKPRNCDADHRRHTPSALPGDTGTWDRQGERCIRVRGRQLCAAAARVGCEYHGPPPASRTAATDSRQLALQLQPARPPPQTQGAMGPWEPHPHNPTYSLQPRDWWGGAGGGEGHMCILSATARHELQNF